MKTLLAEWHGKPQLEDARRIREALVDVLAKHGVEQANDFLLAASELIVNLTRYPNPKPNRLCLRFSRDEYFWWLELLDDGPSFSNFSQQINHPDLLEAAESGMGLKLLASHFDDISYVPACYREDGMNVMLLRQPVSKGLQLKRVLIVDDDPVWRAVLSGYLDGHYQVIVADSATQAFQLILQDKPDLVICDLKMPEHDGSVLFDWISHIPQVATTAFIYLSGCEDATLIENAVSRPIDDFLHKPVNKAELLQTLARVLLRRQHLTDQIQREVDQKITLGLHPSLPDTIGPFSCALRTVAPESGGGDLVLLRDSLLIFADLMGHGVQAKGFVFALAGYLRGLCGATARQQPDVAELLAQVAQGFDDDPVLQETLATITALELGAGGTVRIANAGQPQPVLIRGGEVTRIPVDGPLPGLLVDSYQALELELLSGDRLILFSDGYLDAAECMPDMMIKQLQYSATLPLGAAADFLMQETLNRSMPQDDLTLILLEKAER
ncbi:MAG: SpoIIE family protein phosphatase [Oceanospirillaceae bacterium]|nr:SpoIIE family protein phosphatase [Oceanospirillaceae bacterium]